MMYTSPKFELEAPRSQVEHLQNRPRLLFGYHDRRWLSFQKLQKTVLAGSQTMRTATGGPIKLARQ